MCAHVVTTTRLPCGRLVEFDTRAHRYRVGADDGCMWSVPSVSAAAKRLFPPPADAIAGWAVKLAKSGEDWRSVRNAAAARGTLVHEANERLASGVTIDPDDYPDGYVEALCRWWFERAPMVRAAEQPCASDALAGTFDLLTTEELVDLKTSADVRPAHVAQLNLYRHLLVESGYRDVPERMVIVLLGEDGEFRERVVPLMDGAALECVFLQCRELDAELEL